MAIADTPLVQPGQITLNPSSGPVVLTLQGPAYDSAPASDYGFDISYTDAATASGVFRLVRPAGQYQWQFSTQQTDGSLTGRLAMQLGNDHTLTLWDPADSNNTIRLHPGPTSDATNSGIYWNGNRLATLSELTGLYVPAISGGLKVASNGKVGINTSSPASALDIEGTLQVGGNDSSGNPPALLVDPTSDSVVINNTSNPTSSKLFVNGDGWINGSLRSVLNYGGGGIVDTEANYGVGGIGIKDLSLTERLTLIKTVSDAFDVRFPIEDLRFVGVDPNSEIMRLETTSGYVGINNDAPQARLDVAGDVIVRGVLHTARGGDIDMGVFTAGTNPLLPPP